MTTNTDPVRAQAWAKLEREWAIDGMPADKIRLARAAFDAGAALASAPPSAPVGVDGRWVTQTEFHDPNVPDDVASGNCAQAAVASILGLPLAAVPRLTGLASGDFWDAFRAFLESRGFDAYLRDGSFQPTGMYLASGPSDRGCSHMVVMQNGQLLHDPHPSRTGLKSVEHVWLLVPRDPAALSQQPAPSVPVGVGDEARRLYAMAFNAITEDGSQEAEEACIRAIESALAQQPAAVGVTKRELFTIAAMHTLHAGDYAKWEHLAQDAVSLADATLAALAHQPAAGEVDDDGH